MINDVKGRRQLIAGLGTTAAAVALGAGTAGAQAPMSAFQPARHAQDDWMEQLPGKHRVVLDVTSADGVPDGIRFASNFFAGHKTGYDLGDGDIAIIMVLRHAATVYGYGEAIWAKYGKILDSKAAEPPKTNPHDAPPRSPISGLAKRGVHYVVCGSASLGIARRLAGQDGDADAMMKEMVASMIPSSHITVGVAGVVSAAHAQERGFSYLFVG
jgi:intracellular sulfur oxidation DsrE/DsrF family protein